MEELFLKTEDNVKIALNHTKCGHDSVLIIVHGWFMTKDSKPFLQMAEDFSDSYDVIAMDCRGHGRSGGFYTFTAKENNDLDAVIDYAKNMYKNIYLLGFSLGAALVLINSSKNENVKKVIAVSPPACFEKIENHFWHYNAWLPTLQKCELKTWFSIRPDLKSLLLEKKPAPQDVVHKLNLPVLFIAGENDPTVCVWHTCLLYEKALCKKRLDVFEKGLHAEDLYIQDKQKFVSICKKALQTD